MTISLLRRIWQQIHVESAAPPRQRLTGFEPLEPRMVLSGFAAFFAPDYFSPPPGDFSHIDRSGAEIARPSAAFGGYADYNSFNSPGRGVGGAGEDFRAIEAQPLVTPLDGGGNGNWLSGDMFASVANSARPFRLPLTGTEADDGTSFEIDDSPSPDVTIISVPPAAPRDSITYISITPQGIDRVLTDLRWVTFNASLSGATPMAATSAMSPMAGSSFRSLTDRDYNSVNAGGAVEHHEEAHDYAASHGTTPNPSLAYLTRPTTASADHGATNSADAALVSQTMAGANSAAGQSVEGTRANGQAGGATNGSGDHAQNELLELTDGERLKLKRKLAGSTMEDEEGTNSARSDRTEESDGQVAYDPVRPFDVTAAANGQVRLVAGNDLADDGLIEVLAADVTAIIANCDVIDQAAGNRHIVMEPAVATYQAFETVVDGDGSVATDAVADAARLAAVAMSGQPVVQAE